MDRSVAPLQDRFWEKVDKTPGQGPNGDCWIWAGGKNARGYGRIGLGRRAVGHEYAHRLAATWAYGLIPDGMEVCHACDNPPCVNPAHLFIGTKRDNMRDAVQKGRTSHASKTPREKNSHAKLNEQQVAALRQLMAQGVSQRLAGLQFGIGQTQAGRIARNEHWPV